MVTDFVCVLDVVLSLGYQCSYGPGCQVALVIVLCLPNNFNDQTKNTQKDPQKRPFSIQKIN